MPLPAASPAADSVCPSRPWALRHWSLLAAGLLLGAAGAAQDAPNAGDETKTTEARRTTTAPVIDGRLDDAVWAEATVIENLHQVTPVEFTTPTERTIVYLLYDAETLYVGARMFDKEPERISARILRQGQPIGPDDRLFVHLDPFGSGRSGYMFGVNANGVRFDGVFQNISDRVFDWDGIYRAAATIDAEGWTAEFAIPFKTLSFDPAKDSWRMNFVRYITRRNEQMAWVSRNRNTDPTTMGTITGLRGLEQGMGLDVIPSMSVRSRKTFETPTSDTARSDDSEPSLDVFYKLTPALNAALTINTDFSATEVDNRQVNLTRFSLFFPEKRDFFLQDLDIFQFASIGRLNSGNDGLVNAATTQPSRENGRPFFSRRLGITPSGQEVPLEYGGKLSGRVGRWNVGALSVRQDEYVDVNATTTFVGRVAANVLESSSVGFIATSGDPTSNFDNTLFGTDFRYVNNRLPGNRSLEADAWYQQSDSEDLSGDDSAFGVGMRMPNNTGLRGGLAFRRLEQNFNPALGYVSRTGIDDYTAEFGHTWRRRGSSTVQTLYSGVDTQRIEYLDDGRIQSQVVALRAFEAETSGRDELWLRGYHSQEGLREPFEIAEGVILAPIDYTFDEYELRVATGNQRKLSGAFEYREGEFYDGERLHLFGALSYRPNRHFRATVEYEYNDVELPAGDFIVRLTRLTLETAFSATWSWVNLIQYDNVSETVGVNSRLHWVPEAGREGFVVLNHNLVRNPLDPNGDYDFHSTYSEAALKFGYTFRF